MPDRELPAGRLAPLPPLPPTRRADQGATRVTIALLSTLLLHGAPLLLLLQRATSREAPLEVTLLERQPAQAAVVPVRPAPLPPFRETLRARSLPRLGRLPVLPTREELARGNLRPVPARLLVADALAPRPALAPAPLRGAPLRPPATVAPEGIRSGPTPGAAEAKNPEAKQPEAKPPEPVKPEAKLPEPVKPEAKLPEPVKPEAKLPEPVTPEPKPPEPVKPEAKLPEPVKPEAKPPEPVKPEPPPAPRPEPRLVIRDPDDPSPPPVPLLATAAAPAAPDPTRRLVDAIAAAAHETANGAPASAPDGLVIDPLLAALRPGPEEPGSSELAGARSGDSAGLGTAPEPGGGALPGLPGQSGDGASGRASPGGLVATDPGGVPVRTPVSARAGEPGSDPGNGGLSGPAGAGGPSGPLARKGVADGAPDGTRTEGRPGSGRAFEGDFEELDETEEVHVRAWVRQLKRAIAGQWNTPPGMDRQAVRGRTAEVEFAIRRDGKLLLVRLSSSTGEPALDHAVLQAFRRAIIPAFPEELPGDSRGWRASFKY